uniref:Uncharacterized protein n=1 Tax=Rhizophora mucronata TaxID=61149 RepID=A0A2P2J081_RHIMU
METNSLQYSPSLLWFYGTLLISKLLPLCLYLHKFHEQKGIQAQEVSPSGNLSTSFRVSTSDQNALSLHH